MKFRLPNTIATLALLFTISACNRAPTAHNAEIESQSYAAEDVRIGREAIPLSEVSLLARTGLAKEALAAVKERHIPERLSAEQELQFRGFANAELLAALKDARYILTPIQKDIYDEARTKQVAQKEQEANRKNLEADNLIQRANETSAVEQEEIQRRAQLSQFALRQSDQRVAEQTARERQQIRDIEIRSRIQDQQNRNYPIYPIYPINRVQVPNYPVSRTTPSRPRN